MPVQQSLAINPVDSSVTTPGSSADATSRRVFVAVAGETRRVGGRAMVPALSCTASDKRRLRVAADWHGVADRHRAVDTVTRRAVSPGARWRRRWCERTDRWLNAVAGMALLLSLPGLWCVWTLS